MDFQKALAGEPVVEIAPRIPVQVGPFGIQASPNRKLIAVTARERADIAEVARIPVIRPPETDGTVLPDTCHCLG